MVTKFSEDLKELACMVDDATTIECVLRKYVEKESLQTFGFLITLMAFPVALPFSVPGVTTLFGIVIIFMAIAMMMNSPLNQVILKIPKKIRTKKVGTSLIKFINISSTIVSRMEFFIKPRFNRIYKILVIDARYFICIVLIMLGIITSLSIPFINTVSAAILLIIGLGIMNKDGLFVLTGTIIGSLFILAFPLLIVALPLLIGGVIGFIF